MAEPIQNPGVPPIKPTPGIGPNQPTLGSGEEAQPRPFSLPPSPSEKASSASASPEVNKPTPMEVARDAEGQRRPQWTPEEMQENLQKINAQLQGAKTQLADTSVTNKFASEHYQALSKLLDKLTPDMRNIAATTQSKPLDVKKVKGESVLQYIGKWINGSQETLAGAVDFLASNPKPNPADYLRLQLSVQRATQRGELFASIIGASVSGIKTIMSTQLG